MPTTAEILDQTASEFVEQITGSLPNILAGIVFLALSYVGVKIVLALARAALGRLYATDEQLIADLGVTVLAIFLWFGVALALLKIIGMGDIAVSLGTATGFIALGVSYALSEMIEDTVAGVYLLRDPDFNIGDRISTEKVTGNVAAIELRKSRIDTDDGNRVVVANRDIEARWTHNLADGKAE